MSQRKQNTPNTVEDLMYAINTLENTQINKLTKCIFGGKTRYHVKEFVHIHMTNKITQSVIKIHDKVYYHQFDIDLHGS